MEVFPPFLNMAGHVVIVKYIFFQIQQFYVYLIASVTTCDQVQ